MEKIEKIFKELDDFELAFLYKYNSNSYLKATEDKIKNIYIERGLDKNRIEQLITEYSKKIFKDNKIRCSRCKSDKIIKYVEDDKKYIGDLPYFACCEICGLDERIPKKSIGRRIIEFFGKALEFLGHFISS